MASGRELGIRKSARNGNDATQGPGEHDCCDAVAVSRNERGRCKDAGTHDDTDRESHGIQHGDRRPWSVAKFLTHGLFSAQVYRSLENSKLKLALRRDERWLVVARPPLKTSFTRAAANAILD